MSTPIEIVRAQWDWVRESHRSITTPPHTWDEFDAAFVFVLDDAERFQALERAHDGRSVYAMCIESHDEKARFTGYDLVECPLSELADRLREGGR